MNGLKCQAPVLYSKSSFAPLMSDVSDFDVNNFEKEIGGINYNDFLLELKDIYSILTHGGIKDMATNVEAKRQMSYHPYGQLWIRRD